MNGIKWAGVNIFDNFFHNLFTCFFSQALGTTGIFRWEINWYTDLNITGQYTKYSPAHDSPLLMQCCAGNRHKEALR